MFCHHCGASVDANVRFCPACGQPLQVRGESSSPGPFQQSPFVPPAQVHVQTWHWIGQGWDIVKAEWTTYALLTLVFSAIASAVPLILQGPMAAGFHFAVMRRMSRGRTEIGDLFRGFDFFVPNMVAGLLIAVFVFGGTLLLIIPGLVLAAAYMFTYLFIMDRKMDFWPAMQASMGVVSRDYFGFTMFLLALILVNILGALCCLVGLLWTIPVQYAAVTVAYKEVVGFAEQA